MMPEKALKTGPDLVGQHHQKVWLGIKRKHTQQGGARSQPKAYLNQALARHVRHLAAVAPTLGDGWALHARAG